MHPELIGYLTSKSKSKIKMEIVCEIIKWLSFGIDSIASIIMALAWIAVGAHFLSETFYSIVFVYFISEIIYFALKTLSV